MKKMFFVLLLLAMGFASAKEIGNDPNTVVEEMYTEIFAVQQKYIHKIQSRKERILRLNKNLAKESSMVKKVDILVEKDFLNTEIQNLEIGAGNEISKIRYIKGLQIIRLLYEKVLDLDHHFASVKTFSEISKISNPNQYPEFEKVKDLVKNKKDKKFGFDLTQILGNNSWTSVVNTFTNMLVSNLTKEEKENELKNVDCIIDFTLRMQNDLNTIYYETAFLQKSNESLKTDIETLFKDYTKPIGYVSGLKKCREQDDWDAIRGKLDEYLTLMAKPENTKDKKLHIELEFPIDRLIQFIGQYNAFINSGEKFYQKFNIILNSYQNEKQCESKLPIEYNKLKSDIKVAIDKFNVAYKPVEINGSKMKEILYGINEFQ